VQLDGILWELRYWVKKGDGERGPYDEAKIRESLRRGRMKPTTLVREESSEEWRPIAELPLGQGAPLAAREVAPGAPYVNPFRPPAKERGGPGGAEDGPPAPKPFALWVLQGLLIISFSAFLWGLAVMGLTPSRALVAVAVLTGGVTLVLGLSWRWAWARWTAAVLMSLSMVSSALMGNPPQPDGGPREAGRVAGG